MLMNGNGRYKLSRPITKKGEAFYWTILNKMFNGASFTRKQIDHMGKYMTFQALQQCGLITNDSGEYVITDIGVDYVNYYKVFGPGDKNFFEFFHTPESAYDDVICQEPIVDKIHSVKIVDFSGGVFNFDNVASVNFVTVDNVYNAVVNTINSKVITIPNFKSVNFN